MKAFLAHAFGITITLCGLLKALAFPAFLGVLILAVCRGQRWTVGGLEGLLAWSLLSVPAIICNLLLSVVFQVLGAVENRPRP